MPKAKKLTLVIKCPDCDGTSIKESEDELEDFAYKCASCGTTFNADIKYSIISLGEDLDVSCSECKGARWVPSGVCNCGDPINQHRAFSSCTAAIEMDEPCWKCNPRGIAEKLQVRR